MIVIKRKRKKKNERNFFIWNLPDRQWNLVWIVTYDFPISLSDQNGWSFSSQVSSLIQRRCYHSVQNESVDSSQHGDGGHRIFWVGLRFQLLRYRPHGVYPKAERWMTDPVR